MTQTTKIKPPSHRQATAWQRDPSEASIIAIARLLIRVKDDPKEFEVAEIMMRQMLERRETVRLAEMARQLNRVLNAG